MNYLEIKLAPREYPNGIHIESDEEALAIYNKLKTAMISGELVEIITGDTMTTIRGSDLKGVGLTPSSVIAEHQKRMEAERAQYQNSTIANNPGFAGNMPMIRSILN